MKRGRKNEDEMEHSRRPKQNNDDAAMSIFSILNNRGFAVPTKLLTSSRALTRKEVDDQDKSSKRAMVTQNPFLLQRMSMKDRSDPGLVLTAAQHQRTGVSVLQYANKLLRDDMKFVKKVLQSSYNTGQHFKYISYRLRNEEEVIIFAMKKNAIDLNDIPHRFRTHEWVIHNIVKHGRFLKDIFVGPSWVVGPKSLAHRNARKSDIVLKKHELENLCKIAVKNDPLQIKSIRSQSIVRPLLLLEWITLEMVKGAVGKDPKVYILLPEKYKNQKSILMEALKSQYDYDDRNFIMGFAPRELRKDFGVAVAALNHTWRSYHYIDPDTFNCHDSLLYSALEGYKVEFEKKIVPWKEGYFNPLLRASVRQKNDRNIINKAIEANGNSLNMLMNRNDVDMLNLYTREDMLIIVKQAIANNPIAVQALFSLEGSKYAMTKQALRLYPNTLQQRELVMYVCSVPLRKYYRFPILEYFHKFGSDTEVVKAALRHNPRNLIWVTEQVKKNNLDTIRDALYQHFNQEIANVDLDKKRPKDYEVSPKNYKATNRILQYAPESLKNDKKVAMKAIQANRLHYISLSERLKLDRDVVLYYLRNNFYVNLNQSGSKNNYDILIRQALRKFKDDEKVVIASGTLMHASPRLQKDKQFVSRMMYVNKDGKALVHAHKRIRRDPTMLNEAFSYGGFAVEYDEFLRIEASFVDYGDYDYSDSGEDDESEL
jgi:hypothetical protein